MNERAGGALSKNAEYMLASITASRENVEATISRMHGQIERLTSPEAEALPPAGTTISDALLAEAERLGAGNVTLPGLMGAGFHAGRAAILRGLRGRAAAARARGEDDRRPETAPIANLSGGPDVPSQPAEEGRQSLFESYESWWLLHRLPRPEREAIVRAIDQLWDLKCREYDLQVALSRFVKRLHPADVRWRNSLAGELRAQADELGTGSGNSDPFTQGFSLATQRLAGRLRKRAEEIAVPEPS